MTTAEERRREATNGLINRYTSENPNFRNYTAADINGVDEVITGALLTTLVKYPERIDEVKPTNMSYGEFGALIFRNAERQGVLHTEMEFIIQDTVADGSGLQHDSVNVDNPSPLRFNGTFRVVDTSVLGECAIEFVRARGNAEMVINGVQPEDIETLHMAREVNANLVTRQAVQNLDQLMPNGTVILSRNTTLATVGIDPLMVPYERYRQEHPQASELEVQAYALREYMRGYLIPMKGTDRPGEPPSMEGDTLRPALVGAMIGSRDVFADSRSALYQDIDSNRSPQELAATMEFIFNPHDNIEPPPRSEMATLADLSRRWRENGYQGADVLGADIAAPPVSISANDNGIAPVRRAS